MILTLPFHPQPILFTAFRIIFFFHLFFFFSLCHWCWVRVSVCIVMALNAYSNTFRGWSASCKKKVKTKFYQPVKIQFALNLYSVLAQFFSLSLTLKKSKCKHILHHIISNSFCTSSTSSWFTSSCYVWWNEWMAQLLISLTVYMVRYSFSINLILYIGCDAMRCDAIIKCMKIIFFIAIMKEVVTNGG